MMRLRKIAVSGLVMVMAFGLSACGKSDEEKVVDALKEAGLVQEQKDYGTATIGVFEKAWADYEAAFQKYLDTVQAARDLFESCQVAWMPVRGTEKYHQAYVGPACMGLPKVSGDPVKMTKPDISADKGDGKEIAHQVYIIEEQTEMVLNEGVARVESALAAAQAEQDALVAELRGEGGQG